VKPASEGSSVAVIKVKSAETLVPAMIEAAKFDKMVLVEKSIEGGGEYTCCIAGDLDLPIIRIVPAGEFYDYHAKYVADDTQYPIPCGLTPAQEARMKQLSRRALEVLGCTDWGRADFMLDADGNPYFLEVNTAPGMTDHSLPPKAARAVGISYRDLVVKVLSLTLQE
jgi:D-alanine-D-alanine ligase